MHNGASQIPHIWGYFQCQTRSNAPLFPYTAQEGVLGPNIDRCISFEKYRFEKLNALWLSNNRANNAV